MRTDLDPDARARLRRALAFMESTAPRESDPGLPRVEGSVRRRPVPALAFLAGLGLVLLVGLPALLFSSGSETRPDLGAATTVSTPTATVPNQVVVMERNGLQLVLRWDGSCLEVVSDQGRAGGCGADFSSPLNVGVGGIRDQGFVRGWAPTDAARVVMTWPDGTVIEAIELVAVEGYEVRLFLELLTTPAGEEPPLPRTAVAYDSAGEELARMTIPEMPRGEQTQPGRGAVNDEVLAPAPVVPGTVVELAYIELSGLDRVGLYQARERLEPEGETTCLYLLPYGGVTCGEDPLSARLLGTFPYGILIGASCTPQVTNVAVHGLPEEVESLVLVVQSQTPTDVPVMTPTNGIALSAWQGDAPPVRVFISGPGGREVYELFPPDTPGLCRGSEQGPG